MSGNDDEFINSNYEEDPVGNPFGRNDGGSSGHPCSRFVNTTLLLDGEKYGLFAWMLNPGLFIDWTPIHHISLQLSQLVIFGIFLMPNQRSLMRFLGIAYGVSFFTFGYFVLHSLDIIIWSAAHVFVNVCYLMGGICRSVFQSYSKELEQVYKHIFEKLHITRDQFNKILSCKKTTRILLPNASYAIEKSTRVDSLGLLLSGRLLVSQQGRPLHIILPFQFIDSPEYFGVSTDELFQVTISAVQESKIMVWHRDKLRLTIMSDEFLSIMLDHIIGRDVVRKLIQVSDTCVTLPLNNGGTTQQKESTESDPMLLVESKDLNGGQFGTTSPFESGSLAFFSFYKNKSNVFFAMQAADLPRAKHFANEVWSLTKIEEELTQV